MMNEYRKMNNEELVQAAGGMDVKVNLNCQAVLDKDYGKAVDSLQSGLAEFRSNPGSYFEGAKDRIGQLRSSDTVLNMKNAAASQAGSLAGRLLPFVQRG